MMDKSTIQTAAVITTIVATAWLLGGQAKEINGQVKANSMTIAELREDMREIRGLLIMHISGHNHATIVAEGESEEVAQ